MKIQRQSWMLKVSTFVVVTSCFAVLLTSLLVANNLQRLISLWGEDVQLTVYLSEKVTPEGIQNLESSLRQRSQVESVRYVNQSQALESFKSQLSSYAPDLEKDEDLLPLIPSSLEIKLNSRLSAHEQLKFMSDLKIELKNQESVDEVSYGQDWVQKYANLVSGVQAGFSGLGLLLGLAVLFVISNVIRTSVFNRHDEIVVLEMIGASFSRIRKPFLIEGALLGFVSTIFAFAICLLMYKLAKGFLANNLSFLQIAEHIEFFGVGMVILGIAIGTSIGMIASYLCVRSLNTGFSARAGSAL